MIATENLSAHIPRRPKSICVAALMMDSGILNTTLLLSPSGFSKIPVIFMAYRILALILLLAVPAKGEVCFDRAGEQYGINPSLLSAIAYHESNHTFDPTLVRKNPDGTYDLGIMQINTRWIKPWSLDRKRLISDPCYNVSTGARVLAECISRLGRTETAVGCYNAASKDKRQAYVEQIRYILHTRKITAKQITAPAKQPDPFMIILLARLKPENKLPWTLLRIGGER